MKSLADMMAKGSKCRWGNYINFTIFPFSIGLETDPLVYLSKAKSTMDRKKTRFNLLCYIQIQLSSSIFLELRYMNGSSVLKIVSIFTLRNLNIIRSIFPFVGKCNTIEKTCLKHNNIHFKHDWSYGRNQFPWPSDCVHRSKCLWTRSCKYMVVNIRPPILIFSFILIS